MVVSNLSVGGVEEPKSSKQSCLFITDGENHRIQTNMFNNKPELLYDVGGEIPEFLGRNVACSFGEWILLTVNGAGNNLPEVLVNLFSKEIIELPSLDIKSDFYTLTSQPYDPTCHIVYFSKEANAMIFCQPGDKEFTIKKWDYGFFVHGALAVVAGKLFVSINEPVSHSFVVGVIEFKESTYQLEVVKMDTEIRIPAVFLFYFVDRIPAYSHYIYFEYSGELFAIFRNKCSEYIMRFGILKADFLNKKWVSVENLGTLAIFVGYQTAHVQCASVTNSLVTSLFINSLHLTN